MNHSFGFYWLAFFGLILGRYFLIVGGAYWLFYSALVQFWTKRELHRSPPMDESMRRDIKLSVFSAVVFSLCAAVVMSGYNSGVTLLYVSWRDYGLWYLGFSYGAVLILQDAYFYVTHRIFHHPRLFKWLHQGHHRSRHPTPWTSFAFDPAEALVQGLFLVCIVFMVPLHFITLIAVLITMTVWAVLNHMGLERFPAWFPHHWLGKWIIGPAHHSIHHCRYSLHYGLYFTVWDKLLGTHDPDYGLEFDSACRSRN
ncbi:MAG: sterol desaturase family protein [Acaryochloris sp. SU_5_25]|nr:sterol desaturase family protein [Acaryochloris sp. SU_5_25]